MPKQDPITGCMVLTQAEFWQGEAEREGNGRTAGELQAEMYEDMAADEERCSEEMRNDPEGALKVIKEYLDADPETCEDDFGFTSADITGVEIEDAKYGGGFGGSSREIRAKLTMVDGSTRTVEWGEETTYDTRINPGDYDVGMVVVAVNGTPVVNRIGHDREQELPLCETCLKTGGPPTRGFKPNEARYLIPVSTDQGKTIKRWKPTCVWHRSHTWGDHGDWHGPVIELKQTAPALPRVIRNDDV